MKKRTTLYIEHSLVEKAKELGLNVSKVCENALEKAIKRMEGSKTQTNGGEWWTGRDLNPRPQRCQRCDHSKADLPAQTLT